MSSEISEATRDLIMEQVQHQASWIKWAALSSMLMALFAAIGALFATITSNESVLERTEEILEASYLENDRVRVEILLAKHEILTALAVTPQAADSEQIRHLGDEIARLEQAVTAEEAKVQYSSFTHEIFAIGITLLSVAITLTGMAIVANRKFPWLTGLGFGTLGCRFVIYGLYSFF